jgi:ABC-type glycerol-3-phosphate transport system substrate-binding protein
MSSSSRFFVSLPILVMLVFAGCKPAPSVVEKNVDLESNATSAVPLRLWIVSEVSDLSRVERQWRTGSDQPLEIRALSMPEFLAERTSECDVVVFPSRALGELIEREWVIKLPGALTKPARADDSETVTPAAWQKSVVYNGDVWGIPLGASIPVAIVSTNELSKSLLDGGWDELLEKLEVTGSKSIQIDASSVDRDALVDRFLAIAGGLIERSPDYGLLFELQTMKPRLAEPEFVRAAEILVRLASQSPDNDSGGVSVVGNFSKSWAWLSAQSTHAVAIVAPSMIAAEVASQSGGQAVRIASGSVAWNTGSGLMASMSANCRQSTRAISLLRWLGQSETRQALVPLMLGMESSAPISGVDSTAWQAISLAREMATTERVSNELRFPRAEDYRSALADGLLEIITGKKTAIDALSATGKVWQSLTDARGRVVKRSEYERSLGLARD